MSDARNVIIKNLACASPSGAPCTPFSKMGNMMMEQDPVYQTHEKFYDMSSQDGTQVMVLENVPEYGIEQQVRANMGSHWKVRCAKVDPRHFGMGTARPRHYGIAWDSRKVTWNPDMTLESILTSLYARPMMNALSYFTLKALPCTLSEAEDTSAKSIKKFCFGSYPTVCSLREVHEINP